MQQVLPARVVCLERSIAGLVVALEVCEGLEAATLLAKPA